MSWSKAIGAASAIVFVLCVVIGTIIGVVELTKWQPVVGLAVVLVLTTGVLATAIKVDAS